jgi:predicted dehydrogenase
MLDREKPQVAVVAPFFFLQSGVACECMARGIHVFIEKPMAVSLEQLERLRRMHALREVALCPMLNKRYRPQFFSAWHAVRDGCIGEPLLTAQKSYKLGARHAMYTHRATYGGTISWGWSSRQSTGSSGSAEGSSLRLPRVRPPRETGVTASLKAPVSACFACRTPARRW